MKEGDFVQYLCPSQGFWRFGTYVREIRRGKKKGWHIVNIRRKTTSGTVNRKMRPNHVKNVPQKDKNDQFNPVPEKSNS